MRKSEATPGPNFVFKVIEASLAIQIFELKSNIFHARKKSNFWNQRVSIQIIAIKYPTSLRELDREYSAQYLKQTVAASRTNRAPLVLSRKILKHLHLKKQIY